MGVKRGHARELADLVERPVKGTYSINLPIHMSAHAQHPNGLA